MKLCYSLQLRDLRRNNIPDMVSTPLNQRGLSGVETRFFGSLFNCIALTRSLQPENA